MAGVPALSTALQKTCSEPGVRGTGTAATSMTAAEPLMATLSDLPVLVVCHIFELSLQSYASARVHPVAPPVSSASAVVASSVSVTVPPPGVATTV